MTKHKIIIIIIIIQRQTYITKHAETATETKYSYILLRWQKLAPET